MKRTASPAWRAAMASVLLALGCLALVVVHDTARGGRRVELSAFASLDKEHNPFAGTGKGGFSVVDPDVSEYDMENPDQPGRAGSWSWATTETEDKDITEGHNSDWIVGLNQDGWKNPGHVLKGSASHYYNEYDLDENMQPQADIDNEQSLPDHSTSMPYSYLASEGQSVGPEATNYILGFDDYLMKSNGIY